MEKLKNTFIYANKNIEVIKELSKHRNWVLYKAEDGTKKPYDVNGYLASTTNPARWNNFEAVLNKLDGGRYNGIGIVFTSDLGITGIDIDKCVNPLTGEIDPTVKGIINYFDSYTEYSPSGTGIHILVYAKIEKGIKKALSGKAICFEMYSSGRYFTFTANHLKGTPLVVNQRQDKVDKLYSGLSKKDPKPNVVKNSSPTELLKPDHELLEIARKAKNSDKFCSLFDKGDISGYPSPSEACAALIFNLAFYTRDENQIDRLFKMSALYKGKWIAKWDRRKDSMIEEAFEMVEESIGTCSGGMNNRSTIRESDPDDLDLAMGVIESIGSDNINYLQSSFWTWNENSGYWCKEDELGIKQKITRIGLSQLRKVNTSKINSTLEMVRINAFDPNIEFDLSLDTVNCMNGELHFENDVWVLKPHNKHNYNTYVIPVSYDSLAEAPRYEKFKQEIFQNDIDAFDKANALDEMLGYCLLKSTSFEKFFMLIGGGSNGKSVLLNVLTELLGKNNVSSVCPSSLTDKFKRAHLMSKLANIVSEMPEGHIIADAEMKAIVSGDSINAEFKGQNAFDFRPFCTMIFATNHMPYTRDFSDAWFRRPIILEFNNKFEGDKCDRNLYSKLIKELPGILNCAIRGLSRLFLNQDFTTPISSTRLLEEWKFEVNQVEQFIAEKCKFDSGNFIATTDLYESYIEFTKEAGIKLSLSRNNFRNRILKIDRVKEDRISKARGFTGIKLKDDSNYPPRNISRDQSPKVLKGNLTKFKSLADKSENLVMEN